MRSRGSSNRLPNSGGPAFHSRLSALVLAMFATMATIYVAGRSVFFLFFFIAGFFFFLVYFILSRFFVLIYSMWQDAESRVYLIQELDKRTGQGHSAISVDDTLKIIACREQQKKLSALEMDLAVARQEGFVSKQHLENDGTRPKKKPLAVIGIITTFGRKKNRDAIRKAWMHSGAALKKLEEEKGIVVRFVIGRSSNRGDSLDREIDNEHSETNDFIILILEARIFSFIFVSQQNHVEAPEEHSLGATLSANLDKPRVYMGCMKSGEVFAEPTHKWYEPDWWKFGDAKSYFRHASGEIYAISRALAQFISINRSILRTFAHDDISAGSWFIGLDVKHVNEAKFCCSPWSTELKNSQLKDINKADVVLHEKA
ncbi:Glycosyl transferase, family 31 [Corchorus olitorius]|uniref:Hexosyltransferase n=1 Tax=Corchorus olitorius TaxID=93759 RepID=A0A1R3GKM6_9ROSI|nr:Glycosyl transferase, family 31 [Corchorus olitorius]